MVAITLTILCIFMDSLYHASTSLSKPPLYASPLNHALHPGGGTQRTKPILGKAIPGLHRLREEFLVIPVDAVAQIMLPQVSPRAFGGIELRRIGRQGQ